MDVVGGFFFLGCGFRETERGLNIVDEVGVGLGADFGRSGCGVSVVGSGGGGRET